MHRSIKIATIAIALLLAANLPFAADKLPELPSTTADSVMTNVAMDK